MPILHSSQNQKTGLLFKRMKILNCSKSNDRLSMLAIFQVVIYVTDMLQKMPCCFTR